MKKLGAVISLLLIAFLWVITLTGFLGIGPVMREDRTKLGLDLAGGVYVVMEAQTDATGNELLEMMKQTQLVIERRVNLMGLAEPVVTIEGDNRIRVEMPGAKNAEEAINEIGRTAQLRFVLADGSVVLDGSMVKNASASMGQQKGGFVVNLEFNAEGTAAFADGTRRAYAGSVTPSIDGVRARAIAIVLDDNIISAPDVNEPILNGSAQISGNFSEDEAVTLARQIKAGALPVDLREVSSSIQGATLGMDSLRMSLLGGGVGIALIILVMFIIYRAMGFAANLALLLYIPATFWILSLLGAVMTLPGLAGIILSVGMAVDANVIIFARIREEIIGGKTIRVAVASGFKRAMGTIIDSQITTMIAAIALYMLGTGPVRGFATTLMIGIVLSIFTAAVVSQLILVVIAESRIFAKNFLFAVPKNAGDPSLAAAQENRPALPFLKHRRVYYIISAAFIVVGLGMGFVRGFNFGIDFTGGTMMQLEMGRRVETEPVAAVLAENGVPNADILYAGEGNTQIIIRTTQSLNNPERVALLDALYAEYELDDSAVLTFEQFGPSIGDILKKKAAQALIIASIGMLIYIIIRFEWKFGVASIVGVLHDVLILVAFYGLFGITINNPFIAGLLTVVGYSINDTIVIFDRIRENLKTAKRQKTDVLIDTSITQTLFRSLMTALTTVVAITPLFILGGDVIRQFTTPLIVGILAGAASSIFIASPIYYEICSFFDKPKYAGKSARPDKKPRTKRANGNGAVV